MQIEEGYVTFTEEMVLNPDALGSIPHNYRFYREEIIVPNEPYPVECGRLWLPPYVDITKIEEIINAEPS